MPQGFESLVYIKMLCEPLATGVFAAFTSVNTSQANAELWLHRLVITILLSVLGTLFIGEKMLPYPWKEDKGKVLAAVESNSKGIASLQEEMLRTNKKMEEEVKRMNAKAERAIELMHELALKTAQRRSGK